MKRSTFFCIAELLCIISFTVLVIAHVSVGYNLLAFVFGLTVGMHLSCIYFEQQFGKAWGALTHKEISEALAPPGKEPVPFDQLPDIQGPGLYGTGNLP